MPGANHPLSARGGEEGAVVVKTSVDDRTARQAWLDRRVAGWALYDVASSTYIAIIPTIFPILFATVVMGGAPGSDVRFALLAALSLLVAGVATPLIGAMADRGRLLAWLVAATAACCAATAAMPGLSAGTVLLAGLAFLAAQSGYTVAMALYESMLPRLASASTMALVSSFGWACGMLGGIISLLAALALVQGRPETEALSLVFVVPAAAFALLSVPALLVLRRIAPRPPAGPGFSIRQAGRAVLDDLRAWRSHRNSARFLLAYLLINDGSVTVVLVATLYIRAKFGTTLEDMLKLILLYHVIAAPATLAWGAVANRIGLPRTIHLNLAVWIGAIVIMIFAAGDWAPWAIAGALGSVVASTNALCRALFARLVPGGRAAEFFGFNAVVGRMSAALGPLVYAAVSGATGSASAGLLTTLAFLLAGGYVLAGVDASPPVNEQAPAMKEVRS